jgi:hypothetical protein
MHSLAWDSRRKSEEQPKGLLGSEMLVLASLSPERKELVAFGQKMETAPPYSIRE